MRRNWLQIGIVFFTLLWAAGAFGQTSCTSSTGACVPVQVTGPVGTNTSLFVCVGNSTMCSQQTLNDFLATNSSPYWKIIGFYQKAATVSYNDFHSYNSTIYYAAYSTPSGGPNSPVSAISFFQMPPPPQVAPTLVVGPNVVTTGNTGVQ